jgi:hypothetical protein
MSEYVVKTTREIKAALKKEFNHKFSVISGKGTSRHYVHVDWYNGPTITQVDKFCEQFNDTARDDIQTDYYGGRQYAICQRHVTAEEFTKVAERFCKKEGLKMPALRIDESYDGKHKFASVADVDNYPVEGYGDNIRTIAELIYSKTRSTDYRIKVVK